MGLWELRGELPGPPGDGVFRKDEEADKTWGGRDARRRGSMGQGTEVTNSRVCGKTYPRPLLLRANGVGGGARTGR